MQQFPAFISLPIQISHIVTESFSRPCQPIRISPLLNPQRTLSLKFMEFISLTCLLSPGRTAALSGRRMNGSYAPFLFPPVCHVSTTSTAAPYPRPHPSLHPSPSKLTEAPGRQSSFHLAYPPLITSVGYRVKFTQSLI